MTMQIANWENFEQQRMQWHSVGFGVKAAAVSEIDCLRELVAAALDCAPAVANSVMLFRVKKGINNDPVRYGLTIMEEKKKRNK